jgi:hypothetical protein
MKNDALRPFIPMAFLRFRELHFVQKRAFGRLANWYHRAMIWYDVRFRCLFPMDQWLKWEV